MDVHLSCACIGSFYRKWMVLFFDLFVVYYSTVVLKTCIFFRFKAHLKGCQSMQDATAAAQAMEGYWCRTLLPHCIGWQRRWQPCPSGPPSLWRRWPRDLAATSCPAPPPQQHPGSLLVVSIDVLDYWWDISFSPNPSTDQYSTLLVY
jgi:hypothetical protein